jgi:glycosyltransferase involved in cell wall biosynthesis
VTVRLGAVATHPVQYQVPWFRALAALPDVALTVFYGMVPDSRQQGVGFGIEFLWDMPLLEGYPYEVLENHAARPSVNGFFGCDTPSLGRIVRERCLDMMIVTGWHTLSSLQALRACRRAGVPCIVRGESNALKPRPFQVRLVHRWLLRHYSAFLAIGQANERFYLQNGVPPEKVFPGRYCVDNARFLAAAEALRLHRNEIRASWRIPEGAFTVLYCGKLIPKKRPLDLIEAMSRLGSAERVAHGSVHLLIVGEGPMRGQIEALARGRQLPVSMAGFLNQGEVPKAYVAADCLVLPSDYGETWGLVVNEAMACGLPAVVSDRVGCHPDLVIPAETGFVYPCGDVFALTGVLRELATSCGLSADLGDRGRRHVVAGYSIPGLVEGTLAAAAYVTGRGRVGVNPDQAISRC